MTQRSITDFFSPRLSAPIVSDPPTSQQGLCAYSGRHFGVQPSVTPPPDPPPTPREKKRQRVQDEKVRATREEHIVDEEEKNEEPTKPRPKKRRVVNQPPKGFKLCSGECGKTKPHSEFNKRSKNPTGGRRDNLQPHCRECGSEKATQYRLTLEGSLRVLLCASRGNTGKRNLVEGRPHTEATLTYEELLAIYHHQKGFCYYFKTKFMSFVSHSPWMMSLERLDPWGPYSKENCVLCCLVSPYTTHTLVAPPHKQLTLSHSSLSGIQRAEDMDSIEDRRGCIVTAGC